MTMTPAFAAGARKALEDLARRPEVAGAISGAMFGAVVAPDDDRRRYALTGAVLGAGLQHYRHRKSSKILSKGVGGYFSSTAVPGTVHGVA